MSVVFTPGVMQEFEVKEGFSLKFENKQQVMAKVGDTVRYDGEVAQYVNRDGSQVEGRTPSLKGAITTYKWLVPSVGGVNTEEGAPPSRGKEFDGKKGGNFDTFAVKLNDAEEVVKPDKPERKYAVEREDQMVVKDIPSMKEKKEGNEKTLEVANDQVNVKDLDPATMITSSTVVPKSKAHSKTVISSEAENSVPLKNVGKAEVPGAKPHSYTVTVNTPSVSSDATLKEVKSVTVINADESQDAKVVSRYKQKSPEVQEVDGITLRRDATPEEKTQKAAPPSASAGGGNVTATEVVEPPSQVIADATGADATEVDAPKADAPKKKAVKKTAKKAVKKVVKKVAAAAKANIEGSSDFLTMLPEDWGDLHWAKKEKFIKTVEDVGFLNFLLSVETTNAVQNACKERLKELES